ncbi:MAG: hypothetical protein WC943_12370 [Elusimicrobiota bacterium]|jgi:hypothetical protein
MAHGENLISGWLSAAAAAVFAKFLFTPGGWLHLGPGSMSHWVMAGLAAFIIMFGVLCAGLVIPNAIDGEAMRRYAVLACAIDPPVFLWASFKLASVPGCWWFWQVLFWEAAAIAVIGLSAAVTGTVLPGVLPWQEEWLKDSWNRR